MLTIALGAPEKSNFPSFLRGNKYPHSHQKQEMHNVCMQHRCDMEEVKMAETSEDADVLWGGGLPKPTSQKQDRVASVFILRRPSYATSEAGSLKSISAKPPL